MNIYFLKKIGRALWESSRTFRITPEPKLIMTLLVKNEEDILEQNLLFHKSMGVDGFIITDNNSTDATLDIARKYKEKGWVLDIIEEKDANYAQKKWVDRMIWMAKMKYHADWVINSDADELWYSPSNNLKKSLSATHANVLNCEMICVYPEEDKPFWQWDKMVRKVPDYQQYDLSYYSLYGHSTKKVIHRTASYVQISMGNHKVLMLPRKKGNVKVRIYHYVTRGKQHFMEKMINGGKQLEQQPRKHVGRHWRYFYQLYKEGKLEAEYDRVIGKHAFDRLYKDGYIYIDTTIVDYFSRQLQGHDSSTGGAK